MYYLYSTQTISHIMELTKTPEERYAEEQAFYAEVSRKIRENNAKIDAILSQLDPAFVEILVMNPFKK